MAVSIDWVTKIITINKVDMVLIQTVPSVIYQLDLDVLRLTLKDLEDDEDGIPFLHTHDHNASVTVGGAILAQVIQFVNGYTITFENDTYRVNAVGANSNIGAVHNVNLVSLSTSNSAGLQDLNSLQAASFNGSVACDAGSIYSGTTFPVGTRQFPVNNLADAHTIADSRGLNTVEIVSSMTIDSADFSDGHEFIGDSPARVFITIDPATNITNCTFRSMSVTGTLDGYNILRECSITDLNNIDGFIFESALNGTMTLGGSLKTLVMDSFEGNNGVIPTIDMNGSGNNLGLRNYSGAIKITNKTGTGTSELDLNSGSVEFDATCTGGTFIVRGIGEVTDNSVGATIIDHTVNEGVSKVLTRNQFLALK